MYLANKILKGLYLGGAPPPGDGLAKNGVNVLVLTAAQNQDVDQYPGVLVICAPGDDDARPHRLKRFLGDWKSAAAQVVSHVLAGRTVLVTCMAGQNRSALITALAVRELTGWSGQRIVDHIRLNRAGALNNLTFANYICDTFPNPR